MRPTQRCMAAKPSTKIIYEILAITVTLHTTQSVTNTIIPARASSGPAGPGSDAVHESAHPELENGSSTYSNDIIIST